MLKAEIEIGTIIKNRYQIQGVLGRGGFGRTYLASNIERCGELCVLKVFLPTDTDQEAIQRSRKLFEREARVLYKINHPQVPTFLAWFEEAERLFIVQEYIDGKTYFRLLKERQKQDNLFSESEVIQWLKDLLPVLAHLHENNIVHRDISPDNIMLPKGQSKPVLIDFGLVKQKVSQIWVNNARSVDESEHLSFVGKFGYSPPEQIRVGQCYPCSDLYALAVTAIVLLTGREPLALIDQQSLEWRWQAYISSDSKLRPILSKMLAEKPMNRYQSAQEVLSLLERSSENGFQGKIQPSTEQLVTNLYPAEQGSKFTSEFIELCQQELTHSIGPMAKYILEEILLNAPDLSSKELIEAVAAEIPNPQQAAKFRQRLLLSL
ncbi:serine/threonine protein kinase [Phormidesmis priestleyi ULC007]|uniref:non-specific serine/threonine protein kinase n=1 Tax=Phormidesmis priestleyi ULC007 TaxID=1920490 RepID=A0A2T1D4C9_9CYAN|nr:serine/threonine-protein kinase [Phormidesmis priestleyi]PSB15274.1 serine/threonine protein kinase [Phormidesmis priestleyi ULC007]